MAHSKAEKVFFAIIEHGPESNLAYQIGEKLTIGLDPRNDVVLTSEKVEQKHIELSIKDEQIILVQLATDNTTLLNHCPLKQAERYLINQTDTIKINDIVIKFKKDFSVKKENIKISEKLDSSLFKHENTNGINLAQKEINNEENIKVKTTLIRPSSNKNKEKTYLIKLEKMNIAIKWDFVTKFFFGLIFDFFFAYFILSLFAGLKIHVWLFFSFVEIILMFTFKSTAGQFLFRQKFNRQYTVWILILLFLVYPLSKGSFSKKINITQINKSKEIDLHPKKIVSFSLKNNLLLNTEIDRIFYLLPLIKNENLSLIFYESRNNASLQLNLIDKYDSIKLNKFIYRTHPFRLPIKEKLDNLELKNNFIKLITFNRNDLKTVFKENGPFLTYINDSKTFFTQGLKKQIELIELNSLSPVILLRDEHKANLFIIGSESLFFFQYVRPLEKSLEDQFIEKIIGKVAFSLVSSTKVNSAFLSLLDNAPGTDYQVLYDYFKESKVQILEEKNKNLSALFNALIEQVELEYIKSTNKTDQNLIKNLDLLKLQE